MEIKTKLEAINNTLKQKAVAALHQEKKNLVLIQGGLRNKKIHEIILKFLNQHRELLIEARSVITTRNAFNEDDKYKMFVLFDELCTNLLKILRKFCQDNTINKK